MYFQKEEFILIMNPFLLYQEPLHCSLSSYSSLELVV